MPINEHLKQAAAQLRRAADARKRDADDLRKQALVYESDKKADIKQIQGMEQQRMVEMSVADSEQRNAYAKQLALLKQQQSEIDGDITATRESYMNLAVSYENEAQQLLQQAGELERWASTSQ